MVLNQIITNVFLFLIGILGILFNQSSVLIVLMCIEMILLSVNLNFLIISFYLDDMIGQVFSLLILTIAAAESAIGLSILIVYYRVKGNVLINDITALKG